MDQNDRLPAIVEYLKMHPTETLPGAEAGRPIIQIHEHHHYPAPAPPAPPPKPTVAQQVIPWLYVGLMACIIGTICAAILAVVMLALLIGLSGLALAAAVIAHLIKTTRESQINMELARRPDRRTR